MTTWIELLEAALAAEFADRPRVAALATVDRDGRPRARMVVCRRIEPDGQCWIATDARSAKNGQVRSTPAAELVFWLPGRREQFRLAGSVSVWCSTDDEPRRQQLWDSLSDAARALFFGPPPGRPRDGDPDAFPPPAPGRDEPPESFELLVVETERVEYLSLTSFPHVRRRWHAEGDWLVEDLNP